AGRKVRIWEAPPRPRPQQRQEQIGLPIVPIRNWGAELPGAWGRVGPALAPPFPDSRGAAAVSRQQHNPGAWQPEAGGLHPGPRRADRARLPNGGRRGGDHGRRAAGQAPAAAHLGAVCLQLRPSAAPGSQGAQLLLPPGLASQCSWHENLNNVSPLHRFGSLAFFICTGIISLYDCVFKRDPGYNQKLHRDDREHAKSLGLHINEEERERPVGVLSSSVYGRRIHQPVEPLNRDHGRAGHVKADFYRKNDITSIKAPGFGHISPA
uniref:Uncharacterized protein n=1 Tax=Ovis aries TaxID=9940 RepID=A0AC11DPY6_SHEEP